jgi:predicted transcriptional regulator
MIDFACKKFELDSVVKCGLGLSKADFRIMQHLMKNDDDLFSTEMLAKTLSLNITTAQRSAKRLHEKGVLLRTQENLDGGGYVFYYKIKSRQELRRMLADIVQSWTDRVKADLSRW